MCVSPTSRHWPTASVNLDAYSIIAKPKHQQRNWHAVVCRCMILTHGHVDHVGRIDEFPRAQLWVSAIERALPTPIYWDGRSRVQWPAVPTQCVDAEHEVVPGVRIVPTPGHTLGHLSVRLTLPLTGVVWLTADAISRPDEVHADTWGDAESPELARSSAQHIYADAAKHNAWIIYGHCPQQWRVLHKAPHWYG